MQPATIVARLTPPGKAAIACLGVVGPRAWEVLRPLFRRHKNQPVPESPTLPAVYFGALGDPALGSDQVILYVRSLESCEIHCHGGPAVLELLEATLAACEIVPASSQVWAEAVHGFEHAAMLDILTRCPTVRTAAIALDQVNGAFATALAKIDALGTDAKTEAAALLARLRELEPIGSHLAVPWKVAIAGVPNVGKSSLVNSLAGFTRSIVAPTPGTTRDVVSTMIALDGWPIELLDTAGLRATDDDLERQGVARAAAAHAAADLVLWVLDAAHAPEEQPAPGALVVINKIDQRPAWDLNLQCEALRTSALANEGIVQLAEAIVHRLVPRPPQPGEGLPITAGQREAVRLAGRASDGRS